MTFDIVTVGILVFVATAFATFLILWVLDGVPNSQPARRGVSRTRNRTGHAGSARVPDYVSAITAYRAWYLHGGKLKSFNGECWKPRNPMEARCKAFIPRRRHSRYPVPALWHQPPHKNCSCGIYAAKTLDQLRQLGYANREVYGEVYLWGTVVEHSSGWRAQHAYPKRLVVASPDYLILRVPDRRNVEGVPEEWLAPLTEYGADIYLEAEGQDFLLWSASGGYDQEGLKKLPEVRIVSEAEAKAEEEQLATLMRDAIRRARSKDRSQDRWPGPPPSPPALPVHSVADILRILRSRRADVQVQWEVFSLPASPRILTISHLALPQAWSLWHGPGGAPASGTGLYRPCVGDPQRKPGTANRDDLAVQMGQQLFHFRTTFHPTAAWRYSSSET